MFKGSDPSRPLQIGHTEMVYEINGSTQSAATPSASTSKAALADHFVKYGETQYMVTACEILLMLKSVNPNGVECPGEFGSGLKAAVGQYQKDHGLSVDYIAGPATFKSLIA